MMHDATKLPGYVLAADTSAPGSGFWPAVKGETVVAILLAPEGIQALRNAKWDAPIYEFALPVTPVETLPAVGTAPPPVPPPEEEIVRVLRVVEYTGPRKLVEEQVKNSVHGTRPGIRHLQDYNAQGAAACSITAVTLGEFPEVVHGARNYGDAKWLHECETRIEREVRQEYADGSKDLRQDYKRLREALLDISRGDGIAVDVANTALELTNNG